MNCLRTGWIVAALLSLVALVACVESAGSDATTGLGGCALGELALPDGGCQPAGVPPNMPCPPGQHALEDGRCQPAGVPPEACAAGRFSPDDRGGCEAILPEAVCPPGQMAVPGERACREVSPCGEGTWGNIPVEASTEYVDQAYPGSDSDGSRERPWKTVQEGFQWASRGAIVAIAEGRYQEDVMIYSKRVRLWGRCPARTVLSGVGSRDGTLYISRGLASKTEVHGLAVTGPGTGIVVLDARSVVLEDVWIHDAGLAGLAVLELAGVTVRGALVEHNDELGVIVRGSEATIESTVVRATQPNAAGENGRGIGVEADLETGALAKLTLTGSLIEENHDHGLFVGGSEATVEATVVRTTRPNGVSLLGQAVRAEQNPMTHEPAKLSLKASLLENNEGVGVSIAGAEATILATVVRETHQSAEGGGGLGVRALAASGTGPRGSLSLTDSLVEKSYGLGVVVVGSDATIESTAVRATQPDRADEAGFGVSAYSNLETGAPAKLRLTTSLVEDSHELGVFIAGSEAVIEASTVRATQPSVAGSFGIGIAVESTNDSGTRGKLSLTSSLVEESYDAGVLVQDAEATIVASTVRATKPAPAGPGLGDGILVIDVPRPSLVGITATAATENDRAGIMFVGSSGELAAVRSSGNRFGLVLQHGTSGARPTVGAGNVLKGNAERDLIEDGDLPVPDGVLPLP